MSQNFKERYSRQYYFNIGFFISVCILAVSCAFIELNQWKVFWQIIRPESMAGYIMYSCICVMLSLKLSLLRYQNRKMKESLQHATLQNKLKAEAVWQLLDELSGLSEGDLTISLSERDDVTGAIAQSVNYALNTLRELVTTISHGAQNVNYRALSAQDLMKDHATNSAEQKKEINVATQSILKMVASIKEVSSDAHKSSNVADKSVNIAKNGATVVQNSIENMNNIKSHIQATQVQIKKLDDSSQQIGETISLIDDITEQTNILALNAAIQAAMAGEAGKGFAVVAEEVQRLAERSNHATRQIKLIVSLIQKDTKESIRLMEQSTTEVGQGARLAHDAGLALENIETVSIELNDLIERISHEAGTQAKMSEIIADNMRHIKKNTETTHQETQEASKRISQLVGLAVELNNSIDGFTLPKEESTFSANHQEFLGREQNG
tara:strand:- start:5752 stop:7068 length:1317 start_codon:yes stop_codon:yes gene_type:complete